MELRKKKTSAIKTPYVTWTHPNFDSRFVVCVVNTGGVDLDDADVQVTIPRGLTLASDTTRVVEISPVGTMDPLYWRYKVNNCPNGFYYYPSYVNGRTLIFKAAGKWTANERRFFAVYWNSATSKLYRYPNGGNTIPYTINHLGVAAQNYTVAITLGSTGDLYQIAINGTNYSYSQTSTDTPVSVATSLANLINAGMLVTASNSSTSTVTMTPTNPVNPFNVSVSGSTHPENLALTQPTNYILYRPGPNSDTIFASQSSGRLTKIGLPMRPVNGNIVIYAMTSGQAYHFVTYNGSSGFTSATQSTVDVESPQITVSGTLSETANNWTGTYTAVYKNHFFNSPYSDNSGNWSLQSGNSLRLTLTETVKTSFTPTQSKIELFRHYDNWETGDTPSAYGTYPFFYQPAGGAFQNVGQGAGPIPYTPGMVVGSSNATHVMATKINNIYVSGFSGVSSQGVVIYSDNTGFYIGFSDASTTAKIPAGSYVTIDVTLFMHTKQSGTAGYDSVTSEEAIRLVHSGEMVQGLAGQIQTFNPNLTIEEDLVHGSNISIWGAAWFQDNAQKVTGDSWNLTYGYNYVTNKPIEPSGSDGAEGQGYFLVGLVMRYVRSQDPGLIPRIEAHIQWMLNAEHSARTLYGTNGSGLVPYWTYGGWKGPTYTETRSTDGSTFTYNLGDARALTSNEQEWSASFGLWAYIALLKTYSSQFPNYNSGISLLQRMSQFEMIPNNMYTTVKTVSAEYQIIANILNNITNGAQGTTVNNGANATYLNTMAGLAYQTYDPNYEAWQVNNQTKYVIRASGITMFYDFERCWFAPNSTNQGALNIFHTEEQVATVADMYYYTTKTALTGGGQFLDEYVPGWEAFFGSARGMYDSTQTPTHWISITDTGNLDTLIGRVRFGTILASMLDPSYNIPLDQTSGNTVNIVTASEQHMHVALTHLTHPHTGAAIYARSAYLGWSSAQNQNIVDASCQGDQMMMYELWYLLKKTLNKQFNPSTYFRFPGAYVG